MLYFLHNVFRPFVRPELSSNLYMEKYYTHTSGKKKINYGSDAGTKFFFTGTGYKRLWRYRMCVYRVQQ